MGGGQPRRLDQKSPYLGQRRLFGVQEDNLYYFGMECPSGRNLGQKFGSGSFGMSRRLCSLAVPMPIYDLWSLQNIRRSEK